MSEMGSALAIFCFISSHYLDLFIFITSTKENSFSYKFNQNVKVKKYSVNEMCHSN